MEAIITTVVFCIPYKMLQNVELLKNDYLKLVRIASNVVAIGTIRLTNKLDCGRQRWLDKAIEVVAGELL